MNLGELHLALVVSRRANFSRRAFSVTLVLLLHLLALALILQSVTRHTRPHVARETILRFLPLLPRNEDTAVPTEAPAPSRAIAPPIIALPPVTTAPSAPDVQALGRSLFGCAPENLANLSPQDRGRCITGMLKPAEPDLIAPRSHVKDPARLAAEEAERNKPLRLQCTYYTTAPGPFGPVTVPMTDQWCMIKGLLNGFAPQ